MSRHLHPLPDPDPWTPEDGYSLDQFVTPASDQKGHSERVRINLKPDVMPVLGQIVNSGQFDAYRSTHDVIRDAIYHRIWFLAEQLGVTYRNGKLEGKVRNVVTSAAHVAEIEQAAHERGERVRYVRALEAEVDGCRHDRDRIALETILVQAEARLEDDWLHEPYRSHVRGIVDKARRETW